MSEGFVRLSRKFFSHYLWEEEREFSRAEAWIDLIRTASFEENKTLVKGVLITVPRGGIVATERFLSGRWKWSRTKTRAFLGMLEQDGMLRREKNQETTVLILSKYETYNKSETGKEPPKNRGKTNGRPSEDQTKESKEQEDVKEDSLPSGDGGGIEEKEKAADPRFKPFTDGFASHFRECFGESYVHNGGHDGTTLKKFLKTATVENYPLEKLLRMAKAAMKHSETQYAKACKNAATIRGFCDNFNPIRLELNAAREQEKTKEEEQPVRRQRVL